MTAPTPTLIDPLELTLTDLANLLGDGTDGTDLCSPPFSTAEQSDITGALYDIYNDPDYADVAASEGLIPPLMPMPRTHVDNPRLQALRDKIKVMRGRLADKMKAAHKAAVNALIDSLMNGR